MPPSTKPHSWAYQHRPPPRPHHTSPSQCRVVRCSGRPPLAAGREVRVVVRVWAVPQEEGWPPRVILKHVAAGPVTPPARRGLSCPIHNTLDTRPPPQWPPSRRLHLTWDVGCCTTGSVFIPGTVWLDIACHTNKHKVTTHSYIPTDSKLLLSGLLSNFTNVFLRDGWRLPFPRLRRRSRLCLI